MDARFETAPHAPTAAAGPSTPKSGAATAARTVGTGDRDPGDDDPGVDAGLCTTTNLGDLDGTGSAPMPLGGGLVWAPWHTWSDNTSTRVDGRLHRDDGEVVGELDVSASSDESCDDDERAAARRAWKAGLVLFSEGSQRHGVDTLVIGPATLSSTSIAEALARFGRHQ